MAACPLCQSTETWIRWTKLPDRLFGTTDERFDVGACQTCGSRFLSPLPPNERLASYYPDGYWVGTADGGEQAGAKQRGMIEAYRRFVLRDHVRFVSRVMQGQRASGKQVRVLDVGCGDGSFLQALGEKESVGLDMSQQALRAARARGIRGVQGTLGDGALQLQSFSLVTAFHFLEHVYPPEQALASMRELLQPGGDLVIQVPNVHSWQARLLGRYWGGLDVPRHLIDYSERSLTELLARCGFSVVAVNHHCLRDNPTTLANSMVPRLYPPSRIAHGGAEHGIAALFANLGYLSLTLACTPFAVLESLFRRGASVMVHARPM